jgi:glycosyltransferase involved in cell wall biosynthesis
MNLLFLCAPLAGYFHNCIRALADALPSARITVVAVPNKSNAPFAFPEHPRINMRSRAEMTDRELVAFAAKLDPAYIFLAGWRDPAYRRIGRQFKSRVPVVMGMDNQWKHRARQHILSKALALWLHTFSSHIWIPGLAQYEYARRLGFAPSQILTGMYSADTRKFLATNAPAARNEDVKRLLFIGNMWRDKGVIELVDAFTELAPEFPDWSLVLAGGGPLVKEYDGISPRVTVTGFVQPSGLTQHLAAAAAFCLPSYHDAWAVVIHEAACQGLPIVATDVCGAVTAFVHEGFNGFRCKPRDKASLKSALRKLMALPPAVRREFGRRSLQLAGQITPELWASKVCMLLPQSTPGEKADSRK